MKVWAYVRSARKPHDENAYPTAQLVSQELKIVDNMRHHYVPQFLLRAWAKSAPDHKIETFRLDLPHLPSSRHGPRHTAYEDNLYSLTKPNVAGMEQQAVEKHFLRHIDELAAGVLNKLIVTGFKELTPRDRSDWARFLMSLRLRQPAMVQQLRTESSEHLKASLADKPEEYDALAGIADPPTLEEWTNLNLGCCRFG